MVPVLAVGGIVAKKLAPIPVIASLTVRGTAVEAVYATGTVEAESRVFVRAKVGGTVAEVLVKDGAAVKKGDLLARIDNPVVSYDLERGHAEFAAATAQGARGLDADFALAKQDRERCEALAKAAAITTFELDRARTRVTQLDASLGANLAQQRALRIDLNANQARSSANVHALASRVADTEVRAPSDGIVLGKLVEVGEVVSPNQTLFKVGDVSSLILELIVDEADVARLHAPGPLAATAPQSGAAEEGSRAVVSLYAFPKQVFPGRVFEVMPDANRERKAFLVKVRLAAPPVGLRSGMSAEANIVLGERPNVVLAPIAAEADGFVWVVNDGRVHKKAIKLGTRDLLRLEVTSGLEAGETVVVGGADTLAEGTRVAATVKEPEPLEALPPTNGAKKAGL